MGEVAPTEPDRQTPTWGRGRLDHFGLQAASVEGFETIRQRLVEHGASGGEVNDFGTARSVFFRDPDGLEGEVLIAKSRNCQLFQSSRAAAARSPARLTSSLWTPGTAAMAPGESSVSGAPA